MTNPIIDQLVSLVLSGKEVVRVSAELPIPNSTKKPTQPKVHFVMADGKVRTIKVEATQNVFMKFWTQAANFKHLLSKVEVAPCN